MNTAVSPQSEFWRGAKDCLPVIIGMLPFAAVGKGRVIYTFYTKQLLFFAGMMVS
ncbi:hypothetical protein [Neisseria zoodegmatis]|uniref:hypothetical protein n=1 Tax=Neisseria zoodegmatis TaxID=326523 RepID=UPI0012FE2CE4|nr:hypothetical protein [Neisseria zoodegmatis]